MSALRRPRGRLVAPCFASLLALAACGGGSESSTPSTAGAGSTTSSSSTGSSGAGGAGGAGGSSVGTSGSGGAGGAAECTEGSQCDSGICKAGQCVDNLVSSFEWPGAALDQVIVSRPDGSFFAAGGQLTGGNPGNGFTDSIVGADGKVVGAPLALGDPIGLYTTFVRDVVSPQGTTAVVVGIRSGDQLNLKGNLSFPKGTSCPFLIGMNGGGQGISFAKLFCNQDFSLGTSSELGPNAAVDGQGNIWLLVSAKGPVDFGGGPIDNAGTSLWLAELTAAGAFVQAQPLGSGCSALNQLNGLAARGQTSPIIGLADGVAVAFEVTGTCDFGGGKLPSNSGSYGVAARYSGAGKHLWSRSFIGQGTLGLVGPMIAADAAGAVYIAGVVGYGGGAGTGVDLGGGPIDAAGMAIAKFDGTTGAFVWGKAVGGQNVAPSALTAFPGGGIAVAGVYKNATPAFDGAFVAPAMNGAFLTKFSTDGDYVWGRGFDAQAYPQRVDVDAAGLVGLTGTYQGTTVDFGGGALPKPCGNSACSPLFVAKFQLP